MPRPPVHAGDRPLNLFGVGSLEALVILLVAFLVLGPTRLISTAKGLGKMVRELRNATGQFTRMVEDDDDPDGPPPRDKPK